MAINENDVLAVYKRQYGTDLYNSLDATHKSLFNQAVAKRGSKATPAELNAFAKALVEGGKKGLVTGLQPYKEFLAGGFIQSPRSPSVLDPRVVQSRRRALARQFRSGQGRGIVGGPTLSLLGSAGGSATPSILGL